MMAWPYIVICLMLCICGYGQAPDQGIYLLGASIIDVGNNNFILHGAKANYFPYGIDFTDSKATGRFSNGKNAADFLAEKLGLPSPKPYLSFINKADIDDELIKGVNFASGGAGILNSTYRNMCIPFDEQVNYFSEVVRVISGKIGPEKTNQHMSNSFFVINIGDNDLLIVSGAEISLRFRSSRLGFDPEKYVSELIDTLRPQLKDICNLGARKFIIISTGAQGCMPILRSKTKTGSCDENANALAMLYNKKLASLMEELNSEYDNFRYSFFNVYNAYEELDRNPTSYGLKKLKTACCGAGKFNGTTHCPPGTISCSKRTNHMFWDDIHNTEYVSSVYMGLAFNGSDPYVYPINVEQLSGDLRPSYDDGDDLYAMNAKKVSNSKKQIVSSLHASSTYEDVQENDFALD